MEPQYGNCGFLYEWGGPICSCVFWKALSSNDPTAVIERLEKKERYSLVPPNFFMNLKFDPKPPYSLSGAPPKTRPP